MLELPPVAAMTNLLAPLYNGEIRIRSLGSESAAEETDEQGFPKPVFDTSDTAFVPCVWVGKKIDERMVAEQTRTLAGYEISVLQTEAVITPDARGRLEIKFQPGAEDFQTIEILAVVNQQNLFWQIYAVDIEE